MSELHDILWRVCRKLPSDFQPYGKRDREEPESCEDCSCGCIHFLPLTGVTGMDWGVCANPKSPRAGLLTFEHQGCPEFTTLDVAPEVDAKGAAEEQKTNAPETEADETLAADEAPLRKLKIDEFDMIEALEQSTTYGGEPIPHFLDSETGEILQLLADADDYDELNERIEGDWDRYHRISALDSRENFRIMENFAESLPESSWKFRLVDALSGHKPFRRFKDAVHSDQKLRDRWFAFQREALKEYARDWLKSLGIEPQFVRPAGFE